MSKLSLKESFEKLPSDEQKRLMGVLKRFNTQLKQSSDRLEWRKFRVWYRDDARVGKTDWMYIYAQTTHQARELANWTRKTELDIVQIEVVP